MFKQALPLILLTAYCLLPTISHAQSADDLQSQINNHNDQIAALQADIALYQKQLDALGKQKNTLQSTISALTISQKQLTAQIGVTQNKISSANLELTQLSGAIGDKEATIAANESAVQKALRDIAEEEQQSIVEQVFGASTLTEAWAAADQIVQFNRALQDDIANLKTAREDLSKNRDAVAKTKAELVSLQNDLTLQKKSVDASKAAQQKLLADTNNQESTYQKLLAQKQAAEKAFEQELSDLESQLNLIVHPGSLPKVGTGVLSWPFSDALMQNCMARQGVFGNLFCITQYFGNTPFATANSQIYNGNGHDGIDIGVPDGTPVLAARGGTVLGTGNTDLSHDAKGRQCWSFGKWVMIKHGNGLSTLYAHLSQIYVAEGQSVSTGAVVGLSGRTGYATGPHLHFGVYATEGTKIMTLNSFRGATTPCANATMPVATKDAYLNPLSYL